MKRRTTVGTRVFGLVVLAGACADGGEPGEPDSGAADTDAATDEGEQADDAEPDPTTSITDTSPGGSDTGDAESEDGEESADGESDGSDPGDTGTDTAGREGTPGMVFTLSNAADENRVVMFARDPWGALEEVGAYPTGGAGNGGGLGSQGSIAIGDDEILYVVNAGDASVSSMRIYDDHLGLIDIASTGADSPTSLAIGDGHLYVLNTAGEGSVAGFSVEAGAFVPIEGASQPLSGAPMTAAAQVGITPDGAFLIVTERATNMIDTYAIAGDGSLGAPVANPSEGVTPFGFDFTTTGEFVVSEAFGGGMNPGASAASSYRVADGGALWTFSASVPSGQTAACWIEVVRDSLAYTTNTGSNTISGYTVDGEGAITLFSGGGVAFDFGEGHSPLDMAVSGDESFLYVLNGAADAIVGFAIEDDGRLTDLETTVDIPATAVGLAGF